jgi:hypothetical protein
MTFKNNLYNKFTFSKGRKNRRSRRNLSKRSKSVRKHKEQKFKRLKCAPQNNNNNDPELKDYTCYSRTNLQTFKELWNNNSDEKINTNNSKEIWDFFKNKLSKECYDELCWLKKSKLSSINNSELLIKEIFKPFSPKTWITNPSTWLSSVDITKIMNQYEKSHSNFKFIGPSPIDFDTKEVFSTCVWEQLCNFNLKEYIQKKITKIGIIFNTDTHDKPGKHWIALFIDLDKKFIFYFDSNGTKMPKQIKVLINRVEQQAQQENIILKVDDNEGFTHQYNDGQCGMYALYFIIELLKENKTSNYFKTRRIKDATMKKYRTIYFNQANHELYDTKD